MSTHKLIALLLSATFACHAAAQERDEDRRVPSRPVTKPVADPDDDDEERARSQGPIVVTGRRLDAARTRIDAGLGATVYSLDNETVENRPGGETGSIAAVLAQAPGTGLSTGGLTVRGSHSVEVRINGVRLPETLADPADHLSTRLAETTRLVTGTLPAQFGFSPGGVISVTTKNGFYQHGGQAELFAGSEAMLEPAVEWAGSAAGTSLFVSGSLQRGRTRVEDGEGFAATDRRSEVEGLAFADRLLGPDDRISVIVGGSRERHRIGVTSLPSGTTRATDIFAVAAYQHSDGPLSLQTAVTIARASGRAQFATRDVERRSSTGGQIDATYRIGGGHSIGAGILLTAAAARDGRQPARRRTSLAAYAQDEWTLAQHLTLNAGARLDWLRGTGSPATAEPRASLVWRSERGLTAHVGFARYAAAEPLDEARSVALPAEGDDYFDAGAQLAAGPWTFGLDAYRRAARNLIGRREVPGAAVASAFTFARARFAGVELSATYARGGVSAWANLALSRSRARTIAAGGGLFAPQTLVAADRWEPLASDRPVAASGGLTWRLGKLTLGGDILAGSGAVGTLDPAAPNRARAGPFATLGLAAIYHARVLDRPTDLRLDLTNLVNNPYRTADARNLEGGWTRFANGRAFLVGIEQGF
jgi:hypothetical protein